MVSWTDAVTHTPQGCLLALHVSPGAAEDRFPDGHDPWRGRIRIKVRAPAEEGQANDAVCRLVAEILEIPLTDVAVAQGGRDRRKRVFVAAPRDTVLARLAPLLSG